MLSHVLYSVQYSEFHELWKLGQKGDLVVMVITFLATILIGVIEGLGIGACNHRCVPDRRCCDSAMLSGTVGQRFGVFSLWLGQSSTHAQRLLRTNVSASDHRGLCVTVGDLLVRP